MVRLRGLFLLAGILSAEQSLRADDREQREYVVYVNGKEAGQTTMDIHVQDNGQTNVGIRADVKFQQLIFNYSWAMDGTESCATASSCA